MENKTNKIIYITRDIERAIGTIPNPDYIVITNKTKQSEIVHKNYPNFVHLIQAERLLGTGSLMEHPETVKIVPVGASIMVFKNTDRIEMIAKKQGWNIINPPASLAENIENKITQIDLLADLAKKYLPEHVLILAKNLVYKDKPFIIQWAHSHTGEGTILINSEKDLLPLKEKFPERLVRQTEFILGPSFTVNAVIAGKKTLIGNISYQITGIPGFTDSIFSTIGNDWALSLSLLNETEIEYINNMVIEIGTKLIENGWVGLFGVDFIRDEQKNQIYLIEINARQPASTSFESFLQNEYSLQGVPGISIFDAHIKALNKQIVEQNLISINDGAQIIQRVTKKIYSIKPETVSKLEQAGYNTLVYSNIIANNDLIRIQSLRGIMETHLRFNDRGKEIESIISE